MGVSMLFFLLLIDFHGGSSFALFGYSPRPFKKGDLLMVKIDKSTSWKNHLSASYYSLPYCRPSKTVENAGHFGQALGNHSEILRNQLEISPYVFNMLEPLNCTVVCRTTLDAKSAKAFEERIEDGYRVNMILDGLPVFRRHFDSREGTDIYVLGFNIGLISWSALDIADKTYFIYNHLGFTVKYTKEAQSNSLRIVGFEVRPKSVRHAYIAAWKEKANLTGEPYPEEYFSPGPQAVRDGEEIVFTYDVVFQESNPSEKSRCHPYRQTLVNELHWQVVSNSVATLLVFVLIAGIITFIYREISKHNESNMYLMETGWKLIHGDIFRPPCNPDLLCVLIGTGVQCLGTITTTIMFSLIGLISTSNWSEISKAILFIWVSMGFFAGYTSTRLHKMFERKQWQKIALKTAIILPGPIATIVFISNFYLYNQKSADAIPSLTMFTIIIFWFSISVPLVFIGSYFGFKKQVIENPVKTSKIPREIPKQAWHNKPIIFILVGGILPFGAVFNELFLILASIWLHQFYCIMGYQFFSFLALLATCAGISILMCYFQLCREDYRWWWISYLTSAFSGVYLFLFGAYFYAGYVCNVFVKPVPVLMYSGYILIGSCVFFELAGTVGFFASFCFTRLIYSSLKID